MTQLLKSADSVEVSTEELRINLSDYLNQVRYADRVVVVKKYSRDTAIILSPRMLQRIIESGTATREDRKQALKELDILVNRIPKTDLNTLEPAVDKAVQAVQAVQAQKRKRK